MNTRDAASINCTELQGLTAFNAEASLFQDLIWVYPWAKFVSLPYHHVRLVAEDPIEAVRIVIALRRIGFERVKAQWKRVVTREKRCWRKRRFIVIRAIFPASTYA